MVIMDFPQLISLITIAKKVRVSSFVKFNSLRKLNLILFIFFYYTLLVNKQLINFYM